VFAKLTGGKGEAKLGQLFNLFDRVQFDGSLRLKIVFELVPKGL